MRNGGYKKAAGVFVVHMDDILVLWRVVDGCWSLPGGEVNANEDVQKTAQRELREDTGIAVNLNKLHWLGGHHFDFGNNDLWEFAFYEIVLSGIPDITLNSAKHSDFRWMMPGDILQEKRKNVIFPGLIQVMLDFHYVSPQFAVGGCRVNVRRIS